MVRGSFDVRHSTGLPLFVHVFVSYLIECQLFFVILFWKDDTFQEKMKHLLSELAPGGEPDVILEKLHALRHREVQTCRDARRNRTLIIKEELDTTVFRENSIPLSLIAHYPISAVRSTASDVSNPCPPAALGSFLFYIGDYLALIQCSLA